MKRRILLAASVIKTSGMMITSSRATGNGRPRSMTGDDNESQCKCQKQTSIGFVAGRLQTASSIGPPLLRFFDLDQRTFADVEETSALPPKADMCECTCSCLLCAISGHRAIYSITSSAIACSDGGTVRPSALAVLRLITSSYLVGTCTGRSAGFSPLRMRST